MIVNYRRRRLLGLCLIGVLFTSSAKAQSLSAPVPAQSPFLGGVPDGTATGESVALTIGQAIARALDHNLGVLLAELGIASASGERWEALSRLLPNLSGSLTESRRKTNLEAFGFPLGPNFPRVVGPFNVFDARVSVSQAIFDADSRHQASAASHRVTAATHTARGARDLVVLVAADLYLEALAAQARAVAARAQLESSDAIHQQAVDLRQGGIIAGLDVVRAEVRVMTDRQRATVAANDAEKAKLQLARVIGLPIGQPFTLVDDIKPIAEPEQTLQQAVDYAYTHRADYLAALAEVHAAEETRKAAAADRLPSVRVNADYGAIGLTPASALPTFNITAAVDVPIFDGGRQIGRLAQAESELRQRHAAAQDFKAAVYYDVSTAFLDLQATQEQLQAATRGRQLADQQLQQSRDRFAAGVASNVEVVQAQEALALATEQAISATYGSAIAKARLSQATGSIEDALKQYLGGSAR